jgi:hypothetical protein
MHLDCFELVVPSPGRAPISGGDRGFIGSELDLAIARLVDLRRRLRVGDPRLGESPEPGPGQADLSSNGPQKTGQRSGRAPLLQRMNRSRGNSCGNVVVHRPSVVACSDYTSNSRWRRVCLPVSSSNCQTRSPNSFACAKYSRAVSGSRKRLISSSSGASVFAKNLS